MTGLSPYKGKKVGAGGICLSARARSLRRGRMRGWFRWCIKAVFRMLLGLRSSGTHSRCGCGGWCIYHYMILDVLAIVDINFGLKQRILDDFAFLRVARCRGMIAGGFSNTA